jgi:hypothetical protein
MNLSPLDVRVVADEIIKYLSHGSINSRGNQDETVK